ncbi:uncharacterized protein LOC142574005 [Dermacentor variabilis]|uniref:uncharacterized protein LOC142574005 n=1 Tax=Dermacentor variabilis TaxID=34621 RepID=UPI003F5AFD4D
MLANIAFSVTFAALLLGPLYSTAQMEDSNPDCNVKENSRHVYSACSFTCQRDEAFFFDNEQPCYLSTEASMLKGPAPALSRSGSEHIQGICKDGICVPRTVSKS